jgi:hypothetical protein
MLHQNVKAQGFRVLNEDEIGAVCGGFGDTIFVNAQRNASTGGGFGGGSGYSDSFGFSLAGRVAQEMMDDLDNSMFDWDGLDANATPAQPPQQPPGAPKTSELCQAAAGAKAIGEVVMTASGVVLAYGALTGPLAPATETAASLSFLAGGAIWGMGSLMQIGAWAGGNPCP